MIGCRTGLLCALLTPSAACLQIGIAGTDVQMTSSAGSGAGGQTGGAGGSTSGGPPVCSPPCPANSTCNPDGSCACSFSYYSPCAAGDGETICCPANSTCTPDGTCSCYLNYTSCPGAGGGTICSEVLLDDSNCGLCGNVCPAGEACLGGVCACDLTTCVLFDGGTICTDPESDYNHCGECAFACSPPATECVNGQCQ